jgi:peroxiredoxin
VGALAKIYSSVTFINVLKCESVSREQIMQTYYQLLDVDRRANSEQITDAYYRQRDRYDPQRIGQADAELRSIAEQRTTEIEHAYRVLADPASRQNYDALLQASPPAPQAPVRAGVSKRELMMAAAGALVGLAIIATVWLVAGRTADPALPPVGETNRPAPEFALPALGGGTVRLSNYRGKVVLINFWGTWCEPCKEETPALQAMYRELHGQGLEIIGVNLYSQETAGQESVREFLSQYDVSYPIALDTSGETARAFQISPIPVSYFVDPDGTIRYVKVGALNERDVRALFERLRPSAAARLMRP